MTRNAKCWQDTVNHRPGPRGHQVLPDPRAVLHPGALVQCPRDPRVRCLRPCNHLIEAVNQPAMGLRRSEENHPKTRLRALEAEIKRPGRRLALGHLLGMVSRHPLPLICTNHPLPHFPLVLRSNRRHVHLNASQQTQKHPHRYRNLGAKSSLSLFLQILTPALAVFQMDFGQGLLAARTVVPSLQLLGPKARTRV